MVLLAGIYYPEGYNALDSLLRSDSPAIHAAGDFQYEAARDHHGQVIIIVSERTGAVNSDILWYDPLSILCAFVKIGWDHRRATDFQHMYQGSMFMTGHASIQVKLMYAKTFWRQNVTLGSWWSSVPEEGDSSRISV